MSDIQLTPDEAKAWWTAAWDAWESQSQARAFEYADDFILAGRKHLEQEPEVDISWHFLKEVGKPCCGNQGSGLLITGAFCNVTCPKCLEIMAKPQPIPANPDAGERAKAILYEYCHTEMTDSELEQAIKAAITEARTQGIATGCLRAESEYKADAEKWREANQIERLVVREDRFQQLSKDSAELASLKKLAGEMETPEKCIERVWVEHGTYTSLHDGLIFMIRQRDLALAAKIMADVLPESDELERWMDKEALHRSRYDVELCIKWLRKRLEGKARV